jgi:ABC-2 type transport system permease protein
MLQFVTNLLGGKLLPLSVFPQWLQDVLAWTPFPYMVSFPTKVMLNQVLLPDLMMSFAATLVWCFILHSAARLLWWRGSYNYSGTGM